MNINLGEKMKCLRKEKNVSQEKLAQYLNVSFQAVSKWENGSTYPDIELLPEISRFFGITVDELLGADQIDESRLYEDYEKKACELYRNGDVASVLPLWQEAHHKMPNHVGVKEMLMSTYFDMDKVKYQKEIVELGTEIYHSEGGSYYKGQAISQIARTYAACGNQEKAEQWAYEAHQLMHSLEMILMQITNDSEELVSTFSFANYWYLNSLFYMGTRIAECENIPCGTAYVQAVSKAIAAVYELVFPNDDMSFEDLKRLCVQYRMIAEDETVLGKNEDDIKHYLLRALACAQKSVTVTEHNLTHPLVMNSFVSDAPSDNKQVVCLLKSELSWNCFDEYREKDWFADIEQKLDQLL